MTAAIPFSHRKTFTDYMAIVTDLFQDQPSGLKILDMPAGSGRVSDTLRLQGHNVTSADINKERNEFIYTDMNKALPFDDNAFDAVICLEGIEHVIDPVLLIRELIRITSPGGTLVVTTPNIMNMYSRLQFLFTGTFFQFCPATLPEVEPGRLADRGHITPMSYQRLRYLANYFGADVVGVRGDRYKRKILFPLYLAILALGRLWSHRIFFNKRTNTHRKRNRRIFRHINSAPLLFGRSMILVMRKNEGHPLLEASSAT